MRICRGIPVYRRGAELPRQHSKVRQRPCGALMKITRPSTLSIERNQPGKPHAGKVFVAVHAHAADVPRFAGGLCAKLIAEGYTGYLVRTTNDEKSGGRTIAQNV